MVNDKHDWLIANIKSPSNTFGDFSQEGLSDNNTQLLPKNSYKSSKTVQDTFKTATGEFDEQSFNQFYDIASQTYNQFVNDNFNRRILNNDYFHEFNTHVSPEAKRLRDTFTISREKNPFGTSSGLGVLGGKKASDFSVREIAQTQSIYNPETGKYEDQTPNDLGFFGSLFNKDTLVLSQYDDDGETYDEDSGRMIKHRKGDLRLNAAGKPTYEKLGNREIYGKVALSPWDVLTVDGSRMNKYDFMDSDGKSKSFMGTALKATATILPYVVPYVRTIWTPLTLANTLTTDLLPAITKSGAGLLFGESVKNSELMLSMNKLQGMGARTKGSVSDRAMDSMWNYENIFGMVGDVFAQISQQRYLAQIPQLIGASSKEARILKEAAVQKNPQQMKELTDKLRAIKGNDVTAIQQRSALLRSELGSVPGVADIMNKWESASGVLGRNLGIVYMAGIASSPILEEAKLAGLNERDAAALFFGTFAGLGTLMSKMDFMTWTLNGLGLDDMSTFLNNSLRTNSKSWLGTVSKWLSANAPKAATAAKEVGEEVVEAGAKESHAWYMKLFEMGRSNAIRAGNSMVKAANTGSLVSRAAINEMAEEVTEEVTADAIKGIYNGARALGLTTTSKEDTQGFDVFDEMLSRYAMAALGGAMGGGIIGMQDALGGRLHRSLPQSLTSEHSSIVIHGLADQYMAKVEKAWKKGDLAPGSLKGEILNPSTKLSGVDATYAPVENASDLSQNDLVYHMIKSHIEFLQRAIYQEGDITDFDMAPVFSFREAQLTNLKHNSAIQDDIEELIGEITDIQSEISSIEGGIKEGTQKEASDNDAQVGRLRARLKPLRDELEEIFSGRQLPKYVSHAMFDMNYLLSSPYGVKTEETYAEFLYQKPIALLTPAELEHVKSEYQEYSKYEKRKATRVGFERFDADLDVYKKYAEKSITVANQRLAMLAEGVIPTMTVQVLRETSEGHELVDQEVTTRLNVLVNALRKIEGDEVVTTQDVALGETSNPVVIAIENYMDLMRRQEYIDPELASFIRRELGSFRVAPRLLSQDGKVITDLSEVYGKLMPTVMDRLDIDHFAKEGLSSVLFNKLLQEIASTSFQNKMNILDLDEAFESLRSMEALGDPNIDEKIKETLENELTDTSDIEGVLANVKTEYQNLVNSLKNTIVYGGDISTGTLVVTPTVTESPDTVESLLGMGRELAEQLRTKVRSPFADMISEFARIDGVELTPELYDTLSRAFTDIHRLGADQFIFDNLLDRNQLEYAKNLLGRLNAVINASVNWTEDDVAENNMIGYASAINRLSNTAEGYEPIPTISLSQANVFSEMLNELDKTIDMLLQLNDSNINGSVRESNRIGARAATLYMSSVAPGSVNFAKFEELGLDTTDLETLFLNSPQYTANKDLIASETDTNPISIPTDANSLSELRIEKDLIEQQIYKMFNTQVETNRRDELMRNLIDTMPDDVIYENSELTSKSKVLSNMQEALYLFQNVAVDPKQFYKDIGGDILADVNELTEAEIVPFMMQEIALKQLYFSTLSRHNDGIDIYNELLLRVLPKRGTPMADRSEGHKDYSDRLSVYNAVLFLNGIPGAGKTTVVANYLTKVYAKYGLNVATFAPYKRQIDILNSTITHTDNVLNIEDSSVVDDLFNSILTPELYSKLKSDINGGELKLEDVLAGSDTLNDFTITLDKEVLTEFLDAVKAGTVAEFKRDLADIINRDNPLIQNFLDTFKRITINGKVPNAIIIDEATLLQSSLLEILNIAIDIHNNNSENTQKVSLILMGDTEQNGAEAKFNYEGKITSLASNIRHVNHFETPKLNQSFRSYWSVINDNISSIRAFRNTVHSQFHNSVAPSSIPKTITLKYQDGEDGLIGFKQVVDYTTDDIKNIFDNTEEPVLLITDKSDSSALSAIRQLGIDESRYYVLTPEEVQGSEEDYVIIDLTASSYTFSIESIGSFSGDVGRIYTALSRAKKGALYNQGFSEVIGFNSTNKDVLPYRVELNKNNLSNFKEVTIENIRNSFSKLEDLPQFKAEHVKRSELAPVGSEPKGDDPSKSKAIKPEVALVAGEVKKILANPEDKENIKDAGGNEAGAALESTMKGKTLTFPHHSNLGVGLLSGDNWLPKARNTSDFLLNRDADGVFLANLLGDVDWQNQADLTFIRRFHKMLKTAIPSYYASDREVSLIEHLKLGESNNDRSLKLIESLDSDEVDFENWKVGVMVKAFDNRFDSEKATGKIDLRNISYSTIGYVVLYDPKHINEDGSAERYITLSALADAQKASTPADVKADLDRIHKFYKDVRKSTVGDITVSNLHHNVLLEFDESVVSKEDILKPISNIIYKPLSLSRPVLGSRSKYENTNTMSFEEARKENSHVYMTDPLIVTNHLFPTKADYKNDTQEESNLVDQALAEMSLPTLDARGAWTESNFRIMGMPIVLVTSNKGLSGNALTPAGLVSRMTRQINTAAENPGVFIPGDVRALVLNRKGFSFSNWFDLNSEMVKSTYTEGTLSENTKKELAGAETNYAAAKILARFTWMLMKYHDAKAKVANKAQPVEYNSFLPQTLITTFRGDSRGIEVAVAEFMGNIQSILNYAIPVTLGETYLDFVGKHLLNTTGNAIDDAGALEKLKRNGELSDVFKQVQRTYFPSDNSGDVRNDRQEVQEHVIARQILEFINSGGTSSKVSVEQEDTAKGGKNKAMSITRGERAALANMVKALRIAFDGGVVKIGDTTVTQGGLFNKARTSERNTFMDQLNRIITDSPIKGDSFKPLFPGGIYINAFIRRKTDANSVDGLVPFTLGAGNHFKDFTVDTDIQPPRLAVNLNHLKLEVVKPMTEEDLTNVAKAEEELRSFSEDLESAFKTFKSKPALFGDNFSNFETTFNAIIKKIQVTLSDKTKIVNEISSGLIQNLETEFQNAINDNVDREQIYEGSNRNDETVSKPINNLRIIRSVSYDMQTGKLEAESILIGDNVNKFLNDNDYINKLRSIPEIQQILQVEGSKETLTTHDGKTITYSIEYDGKVENFANFVLTYDTSNTLESGTIEVAGRMDVITQVSNYENLSNFNERIVEMETLVESNTPAQVAIDNLLQKLNLMMSDDFSPNKENGTDVASVSKSYAQALAALKGEPEIKKALQSFYRDVTNQKKCN